MDLWNIVQERYNWHENKKYETIFTLANGYRGLRGKLELSDIGERGNFAAGVFDKSGAQVIQIVNLPDPLNLKVYVEGKLLDIDQQKIIKFQRSLNMKDGILSACVILKAEDGKITEIVSERFVSRANVHRYGIQYRIKPMNYSGKITIEHIIDGTTVNSKDNPAETMKHYRVTAMKNLNPGIGMMVVTNDRNIDVAELSVLKISDTHGYNLRSAERKYTEFGERVREVYTFPAMEDEVYVIDKYGVTYTSRDVSEQIFAVAEKDLYRFIDRGIVHEKELNTSEWHKLWKIMDIIIGGDAQAQKGIRFNIFQLSSSAYEGDGNISIAAKGLHGEGYKGHVFWDTEIFMLPFFVYERPETARQLLMYRYNKLEGAKANARMNGYIGAQFPWEAADDGSEVTPKWGRDYDGNAVRIWTGDEEFHINSDIVFGIWEYYRATADIKFLASYGLPIIIETAKFWSSRFEYNAGKDRYEISCVIGPDEFHEHVNNNVYTNYLAKWSLKKSVELCRWYEKIDKNESDRLRSEYGVDEQVLDDWEKIHQKVFIPVNNQNSIIEQFEGFFELKYIPITEHDENSMPIWPKFNGIKIHETQLVKQADVIMLMLLLGDEFDKNAKKKNYDYYEARTMHKSSLSPSMYSIMGLNVGDTHNAYKYFMKTLMTDLEDNQGNAEYGIHAAATGGAWQCAVFGFGGFSIDKDGMPIISPWLPDNWTQLSYNIAWRDSILNIRIDKNVVILKCSKTFKVKVYENVVQLEKGIEVLVKR